MSEDDNTEYLNGTWEGAPESNPDDRRLFRIIDLGKYISHMEIGRKPRQVPVRFWIEVEEIGVLRVRTFTNHKGWTQKYCLSPPFLTLGEGDRKWHYRKVEEGMVPEWFEEIVRKAQSEPWRQSVFRSGSESEPRAPE